MSENNMETDVIIVGGGPIGLTLSAILGKSNIENIVLEKNLNTTNWPKAIYINPRSMELFSHYGLDKHLCEVSLPGNFQAANCASLTKCSPLEVVEFTEKFIDKIKERPDGSVEFFQQEITAAKPCRISQIQTEPALRRAVSDFPSCNIYSGWKVTNVSQDEESVTANVVHVSSGETKTIEGRYLVGCDGVQSSVREALGIKQTGEFEVANVHSIYFESSELYKKLHNPEMMVYVIYRRGFFALISSVDTEKLFITHVILMSNEDFKSPEYYVKAILDNSDKIPFNIIEDHSWKANISHVESFQQGRIFLAGDACHCVVPLGGIGVNCGIADAFNIGWKLVAMIQGWGGEWLLDSYASENLVYYKKVIEVNKKSFYAARFPNDTTRFLMTATPFKYLFSFFGRKFLKTTLENEGLIFGLMLSNSPICVPSGLVHPIEDREYYINEAYSACRVPHFIFQDGTTLYSKLGEMFTLVCLSPCEETSKLIVKFSKEAGLPVKVLNFDDEGLRKLFKMKMVLVRPDLCIAWCGDEIPQLSESDSSRTRARVLINVVSGATPLPPEWAWSRVQKVPPVAINRGHCRSWVIPLVSVLVCLTGILAYNAIQ